MDSTGERRSGNTTARQRRRERVGSSLMNHQKAKPPKERVHTDQPTAPQPSIYGQTSSALSSDDVEATKVDEDDVNDATQLHKQVVRDELNIHRKVCLHCVPVSVRRRSFLHRGDTLVWCLSTPTQRTFTSQLVNSRVCVKRSKPN